MVKWRLINWIWQVKGSIALEHGQLANDPFEALHPLFHDYGTSYERVGETLSFRKKDQAAQDKLSVFDHGSLRVEQGATGPVLRYRLSSRTLLFCFLLPFFFLGIAQVTVAMARFDKPPRKEEKTKKVDKPPLPLNPIDKALGAPAPDKHKKKPDEKKDKHSPTSAYAFAAIFAGLYLIGRVLEDRLVRTLFRKALRGA